MRLFIRTLRGRQLLYDVGQHDLVWHVLTLVPLGGLPTDHAVMFQGRRLDLNRTLSSSYQIEEDAVLSAVGAPRVRGTQQRQRRKRQMAEAITLHRERQGSPVLEDDEEAVPTTDLTPQSPTATHEPARAARTPVAMLRPPAPRRFLKRKEPT